MSFKLRIFLHLMVLRGQRWLLRRGWLSLGGLQRWRWQRLRSQLLRSPFYRALAQAKAAHEDFPLVDKAQFMAQFDQINTAGISRAQAMRVAQAAEQSRDFSEDLGAVTVGLSSGTSGHYGMFLANERERAAWVAAVLDRVIGLKLRRRRVAFFLRANSNLYQSVASSLLQFHFYDITQPMADHLARLGELQPHLLVAQPSVLRSIAQAIEAGDLDLNPEQVISVAEVLEPQDKAWLGEVFGVPLQEVYQCTEGFLAASCPAGRLHFNEDFLLIEKKYLDDAPTRFHPIITDLLRQTQPVVRYVLNDVIVAAQEPCPCGSPFLTIERIEGRSDDVLTLPGPAGEVVNVYPDVVRRAILRASEQITFYVVTQTGERELSCYLETQGESNSADVVQSVAQSLRQSLAQLGVTDVKVYFASTYHHPTGSKLRRVRNAWESKAT